MPPPRPRPRPHTRPPPPATPSPSPPPSPSLTLHLPSLHDSLPLHTRLYLPAHFTHPHPHPYPHPHEHPHTHPHPLPAPWPPRLAVLGHAYAPLGGSPSDAPLLRVIALLLARGWVVATFHARGAAGAVGGAGASWTGRAEVADYKAVVAWGVGYVAALPTTGAGEREREREQEQERGGGERGRVRVLCGGYSYGALVAMRVRDGREVAGMLKRGGEFGEAVEEGRRGARRWEVVGGEDGGGGGGDGGGKLGEKDVEVDVSWLLISPPLPPVSSFLMLSSVPDLGAWAKGLFHGAAAAASEGGGEHKDKDKDKDKGPERPGARVLVVYGDEDCFTGARKYRRWTEKMVALNSAWRSVEVEGAGHFWGGEGEMGGLVGAVEVWLDGEGVEGVEGG